MIKRFFVFILLLIGGACLLLWENLPESLLRQQEEVSESLPNADGYVTQARIYKFSEAGKKQFDLKSSKLEFFGRDSKLVLENPNFVSFQQNGIKIDAQKGELATDGEILVLKGNIVVTLGKDKDPTQLMTESLTYSILGNTAVTQEHFKLVTPQSQITGKGLQADFRTRRYSIKSDVHAIYHAL